MHAADGSVHHLRQKLLRSYTNGLEVLPALHLTPEELNGGDTCQRWLSMYWVSLSHGSSWRLRGHDVQPDSEAQVDRCGQIGRQG